MASVSATRSELLARRAQLRLALQGRDLLKDRRSAMIAEFDRLGASILQSMRELEQQASQANQLLGAAIGVEGQEKVSSAAAAAHNAATLALHTRSVAGVRIVEITADEYARARTDRGFSLAGSSARIDAVAAGFETVLDRLLAVAALELSIRTLAEEIARTTRRMNALEHVVVPRLDSERRHIGLLLEQRELEDRVRLRHVRAHRGEAHS